MQSSHDDAAAPLYVPAEHEGQVVALPVLNVPALHAVHVVASIWASLVENPVGQMSQTS